MRFPIWRSLAVLLCAVACEESSSSSNPDKSAGTGGSAGKTSSGTGGSSNAGSGTGGTTNSSGGSTSASGGSTSPTAGSGGTGGSSGNTTLVPFVYVGGVDKKISIYRLDASSGELTFVKSVDAGDYPSFLAVSPARTQLFAVNEAANEVAAFTIDPKTGDLTFKNRVPSGGNTPAHIGVDNSGKYVFVANYSGGNVRVFPILDDGTLGEPTQTSVTGNNAHQFVTDASNKFAFVPNLKTVSQFVFDATSGKLTPNSEANLALPDGAGPRHLAFHPNGTYAYIINEYNDTLTAASFDKNNGRLSILESESTLPDDANGGSNTCAEVLVAPSGKYVYGSNRGHNSIVRFTIEQGTGLLSSPVHTPSGGAVPRHFTLSADGKLMLVANRNSNNIVSFRVDTESGALTKLETISVTQPEFVGIVPLPGE